MSSLTTTPATQLPAHLAHLAQNTALMSMNQSAAAGINAGGWPRISIKAGRFRLASPQGEEVMAGIELDVIIVDANPNGLSKVFYASAYDPSVEDAAPTCYSDNGVGPSSKASTPQCGTCAVCPHNIWGSKITPSGKQTKSCADYKKVAVLIANNPDGPVFEMRVPPASLANWATYIDSLTKRGIPAAAIVTKLSFDTSTDFPKMMFAASGWATAEQAAVVMDVLGSEEVDQCTGKNDLVAVVKPQLAAPSPQQETPYLPPAPAHITLPPIVHAVAPVVAAPPPMTAAPAPAAEIPAAGAKRTRRKATDGVPQPMLVAEEKPAFLQNMPQPVALQPQPLPPLPSAAQHAAPLAPAGITNSALDDMIKQAMAT